MTVKNVAAGRHALVLEGESGTLRRTIRVQAGERTVAAVGGAFEFGDRRIAEAKGIPEGVPARPVQRALTLARAFGSSLIEAEAFYVRATLRRRMGDEAGARADAATAMAIYERLGASVARGAVEDWVGEGTA